MIGQTDEVRSGQARRQMASGCDGEARRWMQDETKGFGPGRVRSS